MLTLLSLALLTVSQILTLSSYTRGMSANGEQQGSRYHHGNLREALIANAIKLIEAEGVAALSLRRIARDTGVSQAAPYSHFPSKKDLITAVCIEGTKWFGESMRRSAEGRHGVDYLAGLAIGHINFALAHPALFHLMSTRDVSEAADATGKVPEIFDEGYQMMVAALVRTPLPHFGIEQQQLNIPLAWSQVYGLSNLLIEGRITPQTYGFSDLEAFVVAVIDRFLQNSLKPLSDSK